MYDRPSPWSHLPGTNVAVVYLDGLGQGGSEDKVTQVHREASDWCTSVTLT